MEPETISVFIIEAYEHSLLLNCFVFQHLEVHDTIAECMIFANHWVAKKITETYPNQALVRLEFYKQ